MSVWGMDVGVWLRESELLSLVLVSLHVHVHVPEWVYAHVVVLVPVQVAMVLYGAAVYDVWICVHWAWLFQSCVTAPVHRATPSLASSRQDSRYRRIPNPMGRHDYSY